jgi:beta-phosphoglucomutase
LHSDYEAVLFDFDGVIIDSEPVHLACWMEALAPFGIHIDWNTYCEHYIGVDDRVMLASLCRLTDPPVAFDDAWARYPLKKRLFEGRMEAEGGVTPEIARLLGRVRERLKTAVVTSSSRPEVEPVLARAGLLGLLDTVVYGSDVTRLKPAPDPYLLAAERLGVSRALVVEDSAAGVESGRAAGFDVLHVPRQALVCELLADRLGL